MKNNISTFLLKVAGICLIAATSLISCTPCECPPESEKKTQNPLLAGDGEFFIFHAFDAEGNEIIQSFAEPTTENTYTVLCKEYYEFCELLVATSDDTTLIRSYKRPTHDSGVYYKSDNK